MTRAERWLLGLMLILGLALRVGVHGGIERYSRADEQVYADAACAVAEHGLGAYPGLVRQYLADEHAWLYPSPMRWGLVVPAALPSRLLGCGPSSLAWLSTLAGCLALCLTFVVGRRLAGPRVALWATALAVTSPLQLAMGRRALGDELLAAIALAALWAVLEQARQPRRWRALVAILIFTAGFAVKETFFLLYPALALPIVVARVRERRLRAGDVLIFIVPPLLHFIAFTLLAGDGHAFMAVLRAVASTVSADYPTQYQSGPPHRLLMDLFLLAPIACLLAVAACGVLAIEGGSEGWWIAGLLLLATLPYCLSPSKCVRFIIASDSLLRVLAAWGVVTALRRRAWWWIAPVVVASAAVELWLFQTVFIDGKVYDPVSDTILRALKIIP